MMVTCKVIFKAGTTKQQAIDQVERFSKNYVIHNFREDAEIGCNVVSFMVLDIEKNSSDRMANNLNVEFFQDSTPTPEPKTCKASCGCN